MSEQNGHWLVRASTIRLLWIVFSIVLALLVVFDVLLVPHPYFGLDGTFGFSAWYGFASCVVLVALAKLLGMLFKRPDDYYGD
jgi:sterol desaturase/sphingolipid hydroxylase (fatty acid hydroxylase superfamily)